MALSPTSSRSSGGGSSQVAYAEITTASTSITATTTGTANTIVTAPAFVADGTSRYLATFFSPVILTPAANVALIIALYVDGTYWGRFGFFDPGSTVLVTGFLGTVTLIPAAGSRTFSVRGLVGSGTGSVQAGVGGVDLNSPAYLRVTTA